jgi:gliding motility-associated-like protein
MFDRWGNLLFESQNPAIGWDGTYDGKLVQEGTYIWQIEFLENQTDKTHMHHGHVTVLK